MKQSLLCRLLCLSGFIGVLFANPDSTGPFVAHPTSNNLFKDCMNQDESNIGFLLTPLAPPIGQPADTLAPLPDGDAISSDPVHALDVFLNNNIIKQMGVGIQVHF